MVGNGPTSPIEASWDPETLQVYREALALSEQAPGTVCIEKRHYQSGRHPAPYRTGYVHGYRSTGEHWHASWAERERCDQ